MPELGFVASLAFVMGPSMAAAQVQRMWVDQRDLYEDWLVSAEIETVEDDGEGVTKPAKVTLKHGDTVFHANSK